jgi:Fur family ferric uptake transcriptional regulator
MINHHRQVNAERDVLLGAWTRAMIVEKLSHPYHRGMPAQSAVESPGTFRRSTQQRREIRHVFERNDRPLAADEVLELAQKKTAGLGIATVYRTIKALTIEGWLVSVELPGEPPRYEVRGKVHHHHFHCLKCRRMFELEGCPERLEKIIPPKFHAVDHVVLIYGFCASCDRVRNVPAASSKRRAVKSAVKSG